MPYFTSTTFVSILRSAAAVARNVPRTSGGAAALTGRRARQALQQLLRETFPSLSSSSHLTPYSIGKASRPAAYALQPIRLGTRNLKPLSARERMYSSASNIRTAYKLPLAARGARMAGNVGFGGARTFASGPAAAAAGGGGVPSGVPMVLRAFASLLSDEDVDRSLPQPTKYKSYLARSERQAKRLRRTRRPAGARCASTASSTITHFSSEYTTYFAYPGRSTLEVPLPPTVETRITQGISTILSLPLSPSFSALLSPTTEIPYAAAEIGVSIFSHLTRGAFSIQDAFDLHYWHRVGPLLSRLDALGFFDAPPRSTGAGYLGMRYEVVTDLNGRPDILRLTFTDRSEEDVAVLLSAHLVKEKGRVWWGMRSVGTDGRDIPEAELSRTERQEMLEVWDAPPIPRVAPVERPSVSTPITLTLVTESTDADAVAGPPGPAIGPAIETVFPMLEVGHNPPNPGSMYSSGMLDSLDASHAGDSASDFSSTSETPRSGVGSHSIGSINTPISDLDYSLDALSNLTSPSAQSYSSSRTDRSTEIPLSAGLLSQLLSQSSHAQEDRERWVVPPSPDDSDVESAVSDEMMGSGVWDDVESTSMASPGAGVGAQGGVGGSVQLDSMISFEDGASWAGAGLAQPW